MQSYKISWEPRSTAATFLQSDTIFGHLAWAVKYLWGEEELERLISELKSKPVFVLSSAFPKGLLPKPALSLSGQILNLGRAALLEKYKVSDLELSRLFKTIKKDTYISLDYLQKQDYVYNALDHLELRLKQEVAKKKDSGSRREPQKETKQIEFHNKIDRQSGTTSGAGELFASPVTFYHDLCFDSWLDTDFYNHEQLQELFNFISIHGFGKDKNTGRGKYEIKIEPYNWSRCTDFNAHLNLSNMVPSECDNPRCSYLSNTKFGKVGGDFAVSETPFKYPVLVIGPGAVFSAVEVPQPPRGSLLDSIHPNPKIVQNLYSYSIPVKIKGETKW
ncbi:MAG: hypothetical protein PHC50_07630 [Candidatus Cloacimonetes bacterium]|nr:hypothetical protein [Candidatus Cloacimonadota bacterium]